MAKASALDAFNFGIGGTAAGVKELGALNAKQTASDATAAQTELDVLKRKDAATKVDPSSSVNNQARNDIGPSNFGMQVVDKKSSSQFNDFVPSPTATAQAAAPSKDKTGPLFPGAVTPLKDTSDNTRVSNIYSSVGQALKEDTLNALKDTAYITGVPQAINLATGNSPAILGSKPLGVALDIAGVLPGVGSLAKVGGKVLKGIAGVAEGEKAVSDLSKISKAGDDAALAAKPTPPNPITKTQIESATEAKVSAAAAAKAEKAAAQGTRESENQALLKGAQTSPQVKVPSSLKKATAATALAAHVFTGPVSGAAADIGLAGKVGIHAVEDAAKTAARAAADKAAAAAATKAAAETNITRTSEFNAGTGRTEANTKAASTSSDGVYLGGTRLSNTANAGAVGNVIRGVTSTGQTQGTFTPGATTSSSYASNSSAPTLQSSPQFSGISSSTNSSAVNATTNTTTNPITTPSGPTSGTTAPSVTSAPSGPTSGTTVGSSTTAPADVTPVKSTSTTPTSSTDQEIIHQTASKDFSHHAPAVVVAPEVATINNNKQTQVQNTVSDNFVDVEPTPASEPTTPKEEEPTPKPKSKFNFNFDAGHDSSFFSPSAIV